jgi:antitoxin component of MazEF toxin-antitoxin module
MLFFVCDRIKFHAAKTIFDWRIVMANQQVITLDNPAGLLLTPELLQQIGVGQGDQIEISVNDRTLTVRSFNEAGSERQQAGSPDATKATADAPIVTIRQLINETLADMGVTQAGGVEITMADGQTLLFHSADNPQLDELVMRADVKEVKLKLSAKASGRTTDEMMESIMDRYDNLFRRLAEGPK